MDLLPEKWVKLHENVVIRSQRIWSVIIPELVAMENYLEL